MTRKTAKTMTAPDDFSASAAAQWLAQHAPSRSPAGWLQWLGNNRSTLRATAYRVPFKKTGRRVLYALADLRRVVQTEELIAQGLSPQRAGLAQVVESGLLNQPWHGKGRIYGQYDDDKKTPFVKLAIDSPLQTFRLSLQEAAALLVQVDDAIRNAEGIAVERDPAYVRKLKPRDGTQS